MEEMMLPGFRFHPTDEELVLFYLKRKIQQRPLSIEIIKQLDIYKYDPWDLPKLASTGEKEWYFYCPRDRKYKNSTRPNRVTGAGFWKATGTDRPIYSSDGGNKCIGLKKSLVFYKGRAAKGVKTDWMMHEFRLPTLTNSAPPKRYLGKGIIPPNDAWAICKIFKKANSAVQRSLSHSWVSPLPIALADLPDKHAVNRQITSPPESTSSIKTASSAVVPQVFIENKYNSHLDLSSSYRTRYPCTPLMTSQNLNSSPFYSLNMSSSSPVGDLLKASSCHGVVDHLYGSSIIDHGIGNAWEIDGAVKNGCSGQWESAEPNLRFSFSRSLPDMQSWELASSCSTSNERPANYI
ncbi:hypothetical protein CDL15_Pgr024299 [Punica granatum]|nr:hypothetical protein CDL15_Pgr024299 [Punica granatum]